MPQVWHLFKGGIYLKIDEIKSCINYSVDIFPIKLRINIFSFDFDYIGAAVHIQGQYLLTSFSQMQP